MFIREDGGRRLGRLGGGNIKLRRDVQHVDTNGQQLWFIVDSYINQRGGGQKIGDGA